MVVSSIPSLACNGSLICDDLYRPSLVLRVTDICIKLLVSLDRMPTSRK